MKTLKLIFPVIVLFIAISVGCSKEKENALPLFDSLELSADNLTATLTFSEGVYAFNDKSGDLTPRSFKVTIVSDNSVSASYAVSHTAGSATVTFTFEFGSILFGNETIRIQPADNGIYDMDGATMKADQLIESEKLIKSDFVNTWISEGVNISTILKDQNVTKVANYFKDDGTFSIQYFKTGNNTTTPDESINGTYQAEKSDIGAIWYITLTVTLPRPKTYLGIFEIKPDQLLWFEIVESAVGNTPPTPEGGFGSSNGGALGLTNIQKFIKIE